MSEFTPEPTPVEPDPVDEPTPTEPVVVEETAPPVVVSNDLQDELDYYTEVFESGDSPVTGDGEPSIDLRVLAWRMGYSVLRPYESGWKTFKR